MHTATFLQDLAAVMIVAGLVTVIFHRFKQPVVLGYIIAGVIIGPHTPPFPLIKDENTIQTLAELGVVLLMFSLGLEFSLRNFAGWAWRRSSRRFWKSCSWCGPATRSAACSAGARWTAFSSARSSPFPRRPSSSRRSANWGRPRSGSRS